MYENFTKEQSFLLSLLNFALLEDSLNVKNYSLSSSEYDFIVDQAVHHNVVPLVAMALNSGCFNCVPVQIIDRINKLNREQTVRNMYLINELSELEGQFNAKGLEFILLKGPATGVDLYEDINHRQFGDLDLLVRKEKIDESVHLLLESGYQYFFDLTEEQRELYEKSSIYLTDHDMHYSLFHSEKMIFVELHWALMPEKYSFNKYTESVFSRKKKTKIYDKEYNTLNDKDHILFLSMHGIKHGWSRLYWLCDIVRFLIIKKSIDWNDVLTTAKILNFRRSLYVALNISEFIARGLLDEKLLRIVKTEKAVEKISERIRENLFNNDPRAEINKSNKIFVSSMEHYFDKICFYSDMIFRPTIYEIEIIKLPKQLNFIYYLIRPVRLLSKYTLRLIST